MEPVVPATTDVKLNMGEVSLEQVIRLLWGVQSQLDCLKNKFSKQTEAINKTQLIVEGISQAVNGLAARIGNIPGPRTLEDTKPPPVKETPRPLPKTKPLQEAIHPAFQGPTCSIPGLYQPTPVKLPIVPMSPLYLAHSIQMATPPPPALVTVAPPQFAAVKVDHLDPYKGKIGSEAKQWLTCMLAWVCLNQRMFPTQVETLSFLLMNMEDAAGAWAHPHLDLLGSHCTIIQNKDDFKREFLAAFGDPDATWAVEQKITLLTQTSTCANYITKFCTLAMELDWNDTVS
ncbi:hypothetical protein RhiTH_001773 [Rhizoctonia solani]